MTEARFIGIGVGPGDPELMTLKAVRLIQQADAIAYIANAHGESQAKQIASHVINSSNKQQQEIPVIMPMCDNRNLANQVYDQAADHIQMVINQNKIVVFLCEGDPLFFGSFAYLLERLEAQNICEVVPGISSVHAASSALKIPLTMLKESLSVVSGRHSDQQLIATFNTYDSVVVMKVGCHRQKIIRALRASGRLEHAHYLEHIGRGNERLVNNMDDVDDETGPYFSLFMVTRPAKQRQ
ncbi:precorrin-2 C(20)-methyltransferase [Candidatus Endobugula sertula]|uniref:Precorrin-2 C(20)-methyltransferase n=1 Tax=Candidatus Endobugula sertula TaxID=62101 RepID=A0A1D2QM29_9GAMM|nr:precorrin-2 C(20)-methyltransferase [Candidatus Endobugula sertula]